MEALQSSSFIKRDPIICCCGWAGGIHCMIVPMRKFGMLVFLLSLCVCLAGVFDLTFFLT